MVKLFRRIRRQATKEGLIIVFPQRTIFFLDIKPTHQAFSDLCNKWTPQERLKLLQIAEEQSLLSAYLDREATEAEGLQFQALFAKQK